jgi:hypothetical protein
VVTQGFINTADDALLSAVQNTVIEAGRYTEQHTKPMMGLIEEFSLAQGQRQLDIPKYNEFTATDVTAGVELTEAQDIAPSIISATVGRIALKVIILDDLVDQYNEQVFQVAGRQAGDALGTKEDQDVIALFTGFSKELGVDNKNMTLANANGVVAYAMAGDTDNDGRRFGNLNQVFAVHHPNTIGFLSASLTATAATYPVPSIKNWELIKDYWSGFNISRVQFFEDGNITKVSGQDSGYGAIFSRQALAVLKGQARKPERGRLRSLFATEIVWSERYGVFEVDDTKGAKVLYEMGALSTVA